MAVKDFGWSVQATPNIQDFEHLVQSTLRNQLTNIRKNMSNSQNLLVTMQGPVSEVDVLEHFTVHLEHSAFSIRHSLHKQSISTFAVIGLNLRTPLT